MFCRAEALEGAGGLAEDYFLYFEEQDLVRRLPSPCTIAWCRESLVYHRGASSTGGGSPGRSALQQYYENYSTLKFTWRYYPLFLPAVLSLRVLLKPWLFLWRREFHLYRPFAAALLDFCLGRAPRVWRTRSGS
jgi:GT2 family glycosyltransferase